MLESPVRGKNLYLSSDKSQDIFCLIWEINDTEITFGEYIKKEVVPNIEGQILEAFELWLKPEELSENEWFDGADGIRASIHAYIEECEAWKNNEVENGSGKNIRLGGQESETGKARNLKQRLQKTIRTAKDRLRYHSKK
ncbi:hypothetical protein BDQ17DRAFT_1414803 [Cyathus striatus]|nr:hypothetical protein BDQ17DRAFT_1414803 [Cyathus striatus]